MKKSKKSVIYTTSLFGIFFLNNASFAIKILSKNGSFFDQNAKIECTEIKASRKYNGLIEIFPPLKTNPAVKTAKYSINKTKKLNTARLYGTKNMRAGFANAFNNGTFIIPLLR
jgi:hypothetical protein